jgi:hypothetical protein
MDNQAKSAYLNVVQQVSVRESGKSVTKTLVEQ